MVNYNKKFNKYQRKEHRKTLYEQNMSGTGLYIFENSSRNAELTLPRPTKTGQRVVLPGAKFEGDSYYLQMVKSGFLRLIRKIEQEIKEEVNMEDKLILNQPDTYTDSGKIEHIVQDKKPVQKLNESDKQPQPEVLINEAPVSDGFIIIDDEN